MLKEREIIISLLTAFNRANITQKEVARRLNISQGTMSNILNGRYSMTLKRFVEIVNLINTECEGAWEWPKQ